MHKTPTLTVQTGPSEWEVRSNDVEMRLLGTFYDVVSRDLFVEAVQHLVFGMTAFGNESQVAA